MVTQITELAVSKIFADMSSIGKIGDILSISAPFIKIPTVLCDKIDMK